MKAPQGKAQVVKKLLEEKLGGGNAVKVKLGRGVALSTFHLIGLCVAIGFIVYGLFGYFSERRQGEPVPLAGEATTISAGQWHAVGILSDGTVVSTMFTDSNYLANEIDVSGWYDIVAVSAGTLNTIGLRSDGTAVVADSWVEENYVGDWRDIVAVSASRDHIVGLRSDGTVVSVLSMEIAIEWEDFGQADVAGWRNIEAVSAGLFHTVGLRSDGTVVSTAITGMWSDGNDFGQTDVDGWYDIVAISAGAWHTIGLKSDGTVVSTAVTNKWADFGQTNVADWHDIVAVSAGSAHTVGLRSDGTVVSTAITGGEWVYRADLGQTDVAHWRDIVAIAVSVSMYDDSFTVGLRADGTVVAAGGSPSYRLDVSDWYDIKIP